MVIDTHVHLWNLRRSDYAWLPHPGNEAINRTIEWADLDPFLERNGISRAILVQADDTDADTDSMLEAAAKHKKVSGVVGYVPLHSPAEAAARLDRLAAAGSPVVGVRNLIHDRPDPDWLLRPDVNEGLAMLAERDIPLDVPSVLPRHLEHVATLSQRQPRLRMVIDHLSKPPIKAGDDSEWRSRLAAAAESPSVYAKVSGLYPAAGAMDDWEPADIRPAFEFAYQSFGPERLMYGSDWPVAVLAGGYDRVWRALSALFAELDPAARDAILAGTATSFYRLSANRTQPAP